MPVSAAKNTRRSRRLNIRATEHQEKLIRAGASTKGVTVTNFILESACLQAEQAIAERREFVVSPRQWEAFVEALDRPAEVKPGLKRLFEEMGDKRAEPRK
jgi:uncharacterized protein (DUF1778 family)